MLLPATRYWLLIHIVLSQIYVTKQLPNRASKLRIWKANVPKLGGRIVEVLAEHKCILLCLQQHVHATLPLPQHESSSISISPQWSIPSRFSKEQA